MTRARKFAFDTEFAADGAILSDAPKRMTPDEIDTALADSYQRGKQDALAQAEQQAAAALEALASAAAALGQKLDVERRALRDDAILLARAAARKIAGAALEAFGDERALAAIETAMDSLRHHPRLLIKLSPQAALSLQSRIAAAAQAHGYGGDIIVRTDPNVGPGTVMLDWSDGVACTDPDETAARVGALMDAALGAAASEERGKHE